MHTHRAWTAEDVAELILLSGSKIDVRLISLRIGRSRAAIAGRLKKIKSVTVPIQNPVKLLKPATP